MEHAAEDQVEGCRRDTYLSKWCPTSDRRVLIAKAWTLRRGQMLENKALGHSLIAKQTESAPSGVFGKIGYDGAGKLPSTKVRTRSLN
jgi:hypothetical protein